MRRLALALVATAALTQLASAADLPAKAYTKAPAMVAAYNWTGWYAGVNAGYGWDSRAVDFSGNPATAGFFAANEFPTSLASNAKGFVGGAQIGYNWQMGGFVTGLEADIQGSGIKSSETLAPTPTGGFAVFNTTAEKKNTWFGTVRARIGLPVDNWLFYATGGFAYGNTSVSFNTVPAAFACSALFTCANGSSSGTSTGWTGGLGVEAGLAGNMTLRAEYLYVDLGSRSVTAVSTAPGFSFTASSRFRENIARVALNFRL
jgi:outer membrane immunogenic protein